MFETTMLFRILLSTVLGAIIGLETETRELEKHDHDIEKVDERSRIGGVRTYTLISLLGGIAGLFYTADDKIIATVLFISIILFLLIAYYLNIQLKKAFGMTTEIAILITFISGFLVTSSIVNIEVVLFVLVLLSFFLSNKRGIGKLITKVKHYEVIDLIKFGLVSLVILPLLPNRDIYLNEVLTLFSLENTASNTTNLILINPFQIWLIVVLISGLSIGSYIVSKVFGEKNGLTISALLSGFISSTSSLVTFALKTRHGGSAKQFAGASLMSNATSFITVGTLIFLTNASFGKYLFPLFGVLFVSSLLLGIYLLMSQHARNNLASKYESFTLVPALKFVGIILVLKIFVQVTLNTNLGLGVLMLGTALSGITGIDAPMVATAALVLDGIIPPETGLVIVLLINAVNYIAKVAYSRMNGTKAFTGYVSAGLLVSFISSLIILLAYVL
jgi:uncharacterized membrane protein (DUF4010 family)